MKKQLLEELLVLTKEQTSALVSEDMVQFEVLMQQKQVLMDQLDTLQREQPELRAEQYTDLLGELIALDRQNRLEFDRQYVEAKGKLNKMRKEQRVAHVYNNPYDISQEEGVFFDKK
ncbi:MAG: hypothetical protein ACRCW2_14645 [Cellulosilyticaceae bacterium]